MNKKAISGNRRLLRKRVPHGIHTASELDLPDESDANFMQRLQCLIRSFVLVQAYYHQSYDSKRMVAALPSIYKSRYADPYSKLHKKCLTSLPPDAVDERDMKFEKNVTKHIKK